MYKADKIDTVLIPYNIGNKIIENCNNYIDIYIFLIITIKY